MNKLEKLRLEMSKRGIDIYIIPTADFHESEYVGEHFKARKFITGFTGSNGTAVVTMSEAGLWTDGRYFLQAEEQLKNSGFKLFKMGEENVPSIGKYVNDNLPQNGIIGFDGRVVNAKLGSQFEKIAQEHSGKLYVDEDLIDLIWDDRPKLPKSKIMIFDEKYSGESTKSKIERIRLEMKKTDADLHILTSLYDIAWVLNLRGDDISHVPVILSYLIITNKNCILYIQNEIVKPDVKTYLDDNCIEIREYSDFYDDLKDIGNYNFKSVLLDLKVVNYRVYNLVKASEIKLVDKEAPSVIMKAVKNSVEIENTKKAHLKDAVAMCKFLYWIKHSIKTEKITELSASEYLESLRASQDNYLDLSFDTICGYAEHGAIIHYTATEESNVELHPSGLLLVDSGGHYLEGTTDITRTIALGPITDRMKMIYTLVLKSHLALKRIRFLYGCKGSTLDVVARAPLWNFDIDYKHGTGHGVGHVLNVHEPPNSFNWKPKSEDGVLEAGMITTDEPGIYLANEFGVRIENELLCCKGNKNEYGQFMYFEDLTLVPFELDAILTSMLTFEEKNQIEKYHKYVYEQVSGYLNDDERKWMKEIADFKL